MTAQSEPMAVTLREILRQPDAWHQVVEVMSPHVEEVRRRLEGERPDVCLFTGCGTSYYLSIAAACLFQELTGIPARPVPASELIFSSNTHLTPGQRGVLFGFSRSGETSETVAALRRFREAHRGLTVAITCRKNCAMGSAGDLHFAFPAAADMSVVMTSSFTSMLLASLILADGMACNPQLKDHLAGLPEKLRGSLADQRALGEQIGRNLHYNRFIFLGMGPFFGLASEAMLKMKEMTQVSAEAYSPLEFRHGPISTVDKRTMVLLIESDRASRQEQDVLQDVRQLGGTTFLLGPSAGPDRVHDFAYTPTDTTNEVTRSLLVMPLLQLAAYYRAVTLGLDPDQPQHLNQVVVLDEASLEGGGL